MDEATKPLGRRDRKKHATRQAIVAAALDLFEERGVAATTVDQIAERADVAQRTFFRHFPTKESVLFPDTDGAAEAFAAALTTQPPTDPLLARVLNAFATSLADASHEDRANSTRRQAIIQREGTTADTITWGSIVAGHQIIEEAVAAHAGLPVDSDEVQLVASTALLLLARAMPRWYAGGAQADPAELLEHELQALRVLLDPAS